MTTKVLSLLLIAAIFSTYSPKSFAQGATTSWAGVQALAADERLIVKQKDGKTVEGRMIEASETNLTMSRNGKVLNVARSDIAQLYHSTGKAAKGKWSAIGAGVGAGAGFGIGAAKYSPHVDDSEIYMGFGLVLGAGIGALTGMAIGASKRHRTLIYQAP
ncbi:MAG TPA: hypothetical protein VFV61_09445 [Pyrinomonadaceae bacterium]|nr:hypothetical protein [Pyrinomonadaceae bacterium]